MSDGDVYEIAKFLYSHPLLKQRPGFFKSKTHDFFRVKRAIRALESPDYKLKQRTTIGLPLINSHDKALEVFSQLPLNGLAIRVEKYTQSKARHLGILKGDKTLPNNVLPVIQVMESQEFGPDMYYAWFYKPITYSKMLLRFIEFGLLMLGLIMLIINIDLSYNYNPHAKNLVIWKSKFTVVLNSIISLCSWDSFTSFLMKFSILGIVSGVLGLLLIRIMLYVVTMILIPKNLGKRGLWLFPNLFSNVGLFNSFIPLYGWSNAIKQVPLDTTPTFTYNEHMHRSRSRSTKKKSRQNRSIDFNLNESTIIIEKEEKHEHLQNTEYNDAISPLRSKTTNNSIIKHSTINNNRLHSHIHYLHRLSSPSSYEDSDTSVTSTSTSASTFDSDLPNSPPLPYRGFSSISGTSPKLGSAFTLNNNSSSSIGTSNYSTSTTTSNLNGKNLRKDISSADRKSTSKINLHV